MEGSNRRRCCTPSPIPRPHPTGGEGVVASSDRRFTRGGSAAQAGGQLAMTFAAGHAWRAMHVVSIVYHNRCHGRPRPKSWPHNGVNKTVEGRCWSLRCTKRIGRCGGTLPAGCAPPPQRRQPDGRTAGAWLTHHGAPGTTRVAAHAVGHDGHPAHHDPVVQRAQPDPAPVPARSWRARPVGDRPVDWHPERHHGLCGRVRLAVMGTLVRPQGAQADAAAVWRRAQHLRRVHGAVGERVAVPGGTRADGRVRRLLRLGDRPRGDASA